MNELIEIVSILGQTIMNSDKDIKKSFLDKLKNFKHLEPVRELITLEHKNHNKQALISLKECASSHCVECLEEPRTRGCCYHNNLITPYEKSLILYLIQNFQILNGTINKFNRCEECKKKFECSMLDGRDCLCKICDHCLVERYKNREIRCRLCFCLISEDVVKEARENIEVDQVEIFKECKKCKLVYEKTGMAQDFCYLCGLNKEYDEDDAKDHDENEEN